MTVRSEKGSILDPRNIFNLLFKILILICSIILASLFLFSILKGEYTGIYLLLFIVVTTLVVFRIYWSTIKDPSRQIMTPEPEVTGDLHALADLISRASSGLEYSREKLTAVIRDVFGEDMELQGNGESFLRSLKSGLDEE
ncbi:MAG: hypothetical protein HXS53_10765 [Theionarchaea archaeon]|nr:hypothetical protein [Theionarchaea archaeon]